MPVRIAVDAMGGDHAPQAVVDGALRAAQHAADPIEILLFGPQAQIEAAIADCEGAEGAGLRIVDAPEVIGMGEAPAAAVKGKPRSSIHLGLGAVKQGEADAFVSAGNTGAVMAASLFILGRVPGVARPSVIGFFPTTKSYCIVLDVGTNVDCKPEHLVQFARMGTVYAKQVMKRPDPTVGLLNVGEEPGKGNELAKAAYELLSAEDALHFEGNVEGRDIFRHGADVVVCDGFVGNALLKLGESVPGVLSELIKNEMLQQDLQPAHQQAIKQVLGAVFAQFDYDEFGGAPLLGVGGNVLIGHGGASPRAIEQLILKAADVAEQDVAGAIASALGAQA